MGVVRQDVDSHTGATKLSSLSDPISPIGIVSRQTGLEPNASIPNQNSLNQTPADMTSSANNPTRAMINFLNNGQAVVASHALSSQGAGGQSKPAKESKAAVNKTISDANQIKQEAKKSAAEVKLLPNERKVGQYILGKSIGEGTFGKVKLGRHITTGEKVRDSTLQLKSSLSEAYHLNSLFRWLSRFLRKAKFPTSQMSSESPERFIF